MSHKLNSLLSPPLFHSALEPCIVCRVLTTFQGLGLFPILQLSASVHALSTIRVVRATSVNKKAICIGCLCTSGWIIHDLAYCQLRYQNAKTVSCEECQVCVRLNSFFVFFMELSCLKGIRFSTLFLSIQFKDIVWKMAAVFVIEQRIWRLRPRDASCVQNCILTYCLIHTQSVCTVYCLLQYV